MTKSVTSEIKQKALNVALRQWFSGSAGQLLLVSEDKIIANFCDDLFGYHLVQLQDIGHDKAIYDDCAVKSKILLDLTGLSSWHHAYACNEALPLLADSIDVIVLPHSLDFSIDPQQVLREVERVLIPGGHAIIAGFNPLSLWGLWRIVLRWWGNVPWNGQFLSYRRVVDWLSLLGFDVERSDVCCFSPPIRQYHWYSKFSPIQTMVRKVWPMFAGVYVLRAVKRVSTIRPIKTGWHGLRVFGTRVPEPSTMSPASKSVRNNERH